MGEVYKEIKKSLNLEKEIDKKRLKTGISQVKKIWRQEDGSGKDFKRFCMNNFILEEDLNKHTERLQKYYESLFGHMNSMRRELLEPIHESGFEPLKVDSLFSSLNLYPVVKNLFFEKKIAFFIALNYRIYKLKDKNRMGKEWSRTDWVNAKMMDQFRFREPEDIKKKLGDISTRAEIYISNYNINTGILTDKNNNDLYEDNKKLISHWGLRDEIKSLYREEDSIKKQKAIYKAIERIIDQTIPEKVINNSTHKWNVYKNSVDGKTDVETDSKRYKILEDLFKNYKKLDNYYDDKNDTAIKRSFNLDIKINKDKVINEFKKILNSSLIDKITKIIKNNLKRELKPFDIWYDNFETHESFNEKELDKITKKKYPSEKAFQKDLKNIIQKMGFSSDMSKKISDKIEVDRARGSGHAWGSSMRGEKAHLRTRFDKDGMNYKGYNIAVHELGHNVEQVLSLYYIDEYMLAGVPNTAFSEAFAFIFQKNDLRILGMTDNKNENILRKFWNLYEIIGVALTEIKIWEWLYENPDSSSEELNDAAVNAAKSVWNEYYADRFNIKDSPILGIYSHMLNHPLYLVNYPLGYLIESMISEYTKDKDFGGEMTRMCKIGNLTPKHWIKKAVGKDISADALIKKVDTFIDKNYDV